MLDAVTTIQLISNILVVFVIISLAVTLIQGD